MAICTGRLSGSVRNPYLEGIINETNSPPMKNTSLYALAFLLFLFPACSSDSSAGEAEEQTRQEEPTSPSDAVKQMEKAVEQMKSGKEIEVVDFRELKELMPNKLAGAKQVSSSGEKAGAMGLKIAQAEAEYEDGERSFELSIVDAGGMSTVISSTAAWADMELDRESDDGYERTTTIKGHKAFESYNSKTREGKVALIVADRFIVNIEGEGIQARDLERAIGDLKLQKLARLQ